MEMGTARPLLSNEKDSIINGPRMAGSAALSDPLAGLMATRLPSH